MSKRGVLLTLPLSRRKKNHLERVRTGLGRESAVEIVQNVRTVSEVISRLPGIMLGAIAEPVDKVLETLAEQA